MKRRGAFLLLLFSAALCCLFINLYDVYARPERAFSAPAPGFLDAALPVNTPTPSPTLSPEDALLQQADLSFMEGRANILLVGFDASPEREDEDSDVYRGEKNEFRSDVLMLIAVNFNENTVHMISIPRDTYAKIYNTKGRWKINAAFAKGGGAEKQGFHYAVKTAELLFSVPIDYYAGVNMEGLKKVVDVIGGVDYDVDISVRLNGRVLEPGYQHLSGQQVLDYCRARKGISTDLGRNDRQQRMLMAIFLKLQSENRLTAVPAILSAVRNDLYTNLTPAQVASLAAFALKLSTGEIKRTTLSGAYVSNVYNASYYVLENKKLAALVKEEFGVSIKRDKKYDLSTVRRDKAAAEAKRAAAALESIESMLVLPADTTGNIGDAFEGARVSREKLYAMIEYGQENEILAARNAYTEAVKRLVAACGR